MRNNKHFSLIKKVDDFNHSISCKKCGKVWSTACACNRHEKSRGDYCKYVFNGGYAKNPPIIFESLNDVLNTKYEFQPFPHMIAYDFEALFNIHNNDDEKIKKN